MNVYANLLGKWTKLNPDDLIENVSPIEFISNDLIDYKKKNQFIKIIHNSENFFIHISQLQFTN